MTTSTERPWLASYAPGQPHEVTPEFTDGLDMFASSVKTHADRAALIYFDGQISFAELDELSDALAVELAEGGLARGDRVALYLQNVPQFVISLLGIWKAGAIAVPINPMSKERELTYLLADSGARVLITLESLYASVAANVVGQSPVERVFTTSELEFQTRDDPRLFGSSARQGAEDALDLLTAIEARRGQRPEPVEFGVDDVAVLGYTSGTTGTPKGAMITHGNFTFNAQTYRDWDSITADDTVFAIAPLFHITGVVGSIALGLLTGAPLVLTFRFDPQVALDAIREHRPTFTVGAITVFIAFLNTEGFARDDFSSFRVLQSGGAPISPTVAQQILDATGVPVHNIYGLTETTSPSHAVPIGADTPVDPDSGAFSVGVPTYNTIVRVLGEDGQELPAGQIGEIVTLGPQVVLGYWNKPDETAHALPDRVLHTGDVGFMDEKGWFFIVDRKKDMINAAGYKVWPREVEDVLYEHPAVREVAVVGVPDEYRGETVKAFVSLKPGASAESDELIAFAKERMSAYKYPRIVEFVSELPKTVTGKILRRELRDTP